jgi:iron(III) transport system substrate-binding protein
MNRFVRKFAIASVAALVLAACSTASDTNAPDSTPDGAFLAGETLTVYSGRSESLVDELFTQFTAQTGIALDVRYGDSGELASLILTEGEASPADVYFSQDAGALGAVSEVGLLAELPPDVLEQVDERFRSTSGQWVATSGRVRVVVYNPTLVATPPAGIDDLLDPQWKGKIGYAPTNASWQSFVTALRVIRGEDAARTWLEGFAANEPVPYEKNGVVRDAVNAGEVSLGLVNHYYLYEKIAAEGADAVVAKNHYFLNGDVGGLVNVAGVGVVASSAKQAAALEFVKFLLSAQGQQYFVDLTFEYPMAAGIDAYFELPAFDELNPPAIDLSDLSSIEATQQLLEEVGLLTR